MVDLDSSVDDVELVELDSSVELVELDSSVELVSVSAGEGEGQVSPPRAKVPPRAQSPPAVQPRSQAGDQVIVKQMALVTSVMQSSVGVFLAPPVPPQVLALYPRMGLGFAMSLVMGLEVCRLRRAGRTVPQDLLGPLWACPAWVVAKAAHHCRRVVNGRCGNGGRVLVGVGGTLNGGYPQRGGRGGAGRLGLWPCAWPWPWLAGWGGWPTPFTHQCFRRWICVTETGP